MSPLSKAFGLFGGVFGKKHTEYKVVEGDSLEWLAEKFRTSVRSIQTLNNLQDDIIYTGRYVLPTKHYCSEDKPNPSNSPPL